MNILITGVAGLIGSRLAQHFIERGDSVVGIDDLSGGYLENVPIGVAFHKVNLLDYERVRNVFVSTIPPFDVVYHLAAYAAEGLSPFIRRYNYENNVVASMNVLNQAVEIGCGRFVFASSMAVYGDGNTPFDEADITDPVDPYGVAKLAVEQDLKIAGRQHGLDFAIVRPHNVYGPHQNIWDRYRNVLGIWTHQAMNGKPMTIFGDGQQERAFTYIDDILEPLVLLGTKPECRGQVVNLGGITPITIHTAAHVAFDVFQDLGFPMPSPPVQFLPARHEVKQAWSSHYKSESLLGFEDRTPLKIGLFKMASWAKRQPDHSVRAMGYEITKGLYESWA